MPPVAAGLAVVARDTGRVLMVQRAMDDTHAGMWEFPGGVIEDHETPLDAARREFAEETGLPAPAATTGDSSWLSGSGKYQGFVVPVDSEADFEIHTNREADGDDGRIKTLAWWSTQDAAQSPSVRPEVKTTPWDLLDASCEDCASDEPEPAPSLDGMTLSDPLEQAIALHQSVLDGETPVDEDTAGILMALLEAADAERSLSAASGGVDKNRGNAERLRHYWTFGPGGQRIGWGSPGDFNRCVTELTPHLGVRAKGYCNLRHHDALGYYPATHAKMVKGLAASAEDPTMTDNTRDALRKLLASLDESAVLTAAVSDAPWSPSTADYTDSEWERACVLHLSGRDVKSDHKLPVRSPDGALNRNGVHAAAGRIHMTDAPSDVKKAAARRLVALYRGPLDEDPPERLLSLAGMAMTAAGTPYPGEPIYDASMFADPQLPGATPLTIEGSRVYGHVADWNVCHRSFKACRTAPRSRTGYAQFHTGEVMTSAGPLPVGSLVIATGHAGLTLTADAAAQHYADSGRAIAVVRAGEDKHGVWVAGSIIDGASPRDVATLRRCPLSGDWRDSEMVAALAVNVPGLPIAREHWSGGRQASLVAAGALVNPEFERLDALAQAIKTERLDEVHRALVADANS